MTEHENPQVEEAIKNFTLTDLISGTAKAPSDSVDVYLNADAAYHIDVFTQRIYEVQKQIGNIQKNPTKDTAIDEESDAVRIANLEGEIENLEAQIEALLPYLEESALRVTMRGMNDPERDVISKQVHRDIPQAKNASEEDKNLVSNRRIQETMSRWTGRSIVKMERVVDGAVMEGALDQDGIAELRAVLYDTEWKKLIRLFEDLSLSSTIISQAVDAGFRRGASESA